MPMGDKYLALTNYLINRGDDKIEMTVEQIAKIVDVPPSKYRYPWSNDEGISFHCGWLNAGYRVSVRGQNVMFTKDKIVERSKTGTGTSTYQKRENASTLDIDTAIASIRKFHSTTTEGEHTRFRSWEHCYRAFRENQNRLDKADYLCLQLAFYLASWGMYRGSSFLLRMDYRVHMPVVEIILSGKYNDLFADEHTPNTIPSVMNMSEDICMAYGETCGKLPTATLITKILLGVFGCAPAYDEYFKASAKKYNVCNKSWNKKSLENVWLYYEEHGYLFEELRHELKMDGLLYTPMKLMDMCLWQLGFDADPKNQGKTIFDVVE